MKTITFFKRHVLLMLLAVMCIFAVPLKAQAASNYPGNVRKLSVSAVGEGQVTLKWTKVANASGYRIQVLSGTKYVTAAVIRGGSTTKKTLTKLVNGKQYKFVIQAYRTKGSKKYYSQKKSNIATATPKLKAPAVPVLRLYGNNVNRVSLMWPRIKNATGYEILQKNAAGKYVKVGATTSKASKVIVTIKKLTNGSSYSFRVRSYRKVKGVVAYSSMSNEVIGKPGDYSAIGSVRPQAYTAVLKKNANVTCSNGTKLSLRKGQTIQVIDATTNKYTCIVNNNYKRTFKLYSSFMTLSNLLTNYKKYPTQKAAEAYVNFKGYSSLTPYLIWVNVYSQHTYIFKGSQYNWKLVKHFGSATGVYEFATKQGMHRVYKKEIMAEFEDSLYGKYVTYIQNGQAIHSWPYYHPTLETEALLPGESYKKPASHGCVRTTDANAKWVYDLIPINTTSVIY